MFLVIRDPRKNISGSTLSLCNFYTNVLLIVVNLSQELFLLIDISFIVINFHEDKRDNMSTFLTLNPHKTPKGLSVSVI